MVTPHLLWKFHANRSSRFLVILLTKKHRNRSKNNTPSPMYRGRDKKRAQYKTSGRKTPDPWKFVHFVEDQKSTVKGFVSLWNTVTEWKSIPYNISNKYPLPICIFLHLKRSGVLGLEHDAGRSKQQADQCDALFERANFYRRPNFNQLETLV